MNALTEAAVHAYRRLGWSLLRLPLGAKKCDTPGWQNAPDDVPGLLVGGDSNLAVRLGPRSGMLADVDLDTPEAVRVAPYLLPPTGTRSGTDARPGSHWWYVVPDAPRARGTQRFSTPSRGAAPAPVTYAELRFDGGYTVLPPSLHPDGWTYGWEGRPADDPLPPPPVAWEHLDRSVRETAGAALLLVQYAEWAKQRARHHVSLALGGALLTEGWEQARVERFVFALASAGADEEAADRVDNVRSAADRLRRGEQLQGWPTLADLAGSATVDQLKRFLGVSQGGGGWAAIMGRQTPTNGPVPPAGGTPGTQTQQAPQPAPVFGTAQQAAQQTATQTRTQGVKDAEVAFNVHLAITHQFWLARDEGLGLYVYEDGVYRYDPGELRLRLAIQAEILNVFGVTYLKTEVVKTVLYHLRVNAPDLDPAPQRGWLHVLNGRVNILTGDREPHDPKHRTTALLPIVYDPQATCPSIEAFCAQVFPADALAAGVPWEVAALAIHPFKGIDKAVLLLGEGENGKGIFLDLMRAFVGPDNCSHVSLQKIGSNDFASSDLVGKLLNVCYDLPSQRLEDSGDFKAIVSGETIRAERKGMPAFRFEPYCRLLFSANNLPDSVDVSQGYFRRWHLIPFDQTFDQDNPARRPRHEIERETQQPGELSGLLNLALPHLRRFLAGDQPRITDSMRESLVEFKSVLDPLPVWLQQSLVFNAQGWIPTRDLVLRYKERRKNGVAPTYKQVGTAMRSAFPGARTDQRQTGGTGSGAAQMSGQQPQAGERLRGWVGVSWRNQWP